MSTGYDVAIVGGGVIGCSAAWRLASSGARVIVIDKGEPGQEASSAAGGMLAPLAEADHADAFLSLTLESRRIYPEFIAELEALTGIDIEYRREGTLYLALNSHDEDELNNRYAWQKAAGIYVQKLSREETLAREPHLNPDLKWSLFFPDDHQLDNWKLAEALTLAARKAGADFSVNTEVSGIDVRNGKVEGVLAAGKSIQASTVLLAAGCWSSSLRAEVPVEPVRGQMMSLKPAEGVSLSHVVYSTRGYLVPRHSGSIIAGSTTENVGYLKAVTTGGINKIISTSFEMLPALNQAVIEDTWSGLRPKSEDGWPIIGRDEKIEGLVYATGHYRNGILLTPVTARIIRDLILEGSTGIDISSFSISRFRNAAQAA